MEKSANVHTFSRVQVEAHDQPDDLWMIIYNKVYNMTDFVHMHPGGPEMLFECGGIDATSEFEDVGHSSVALAMLQPYEQGQLPAHERKDYPHMNAPEKPLAPARAPKGRKSSCRSRNMVIPYLVGAALLSFATILLLQRAKWVQIST